MKILFVNLVEFPPIEKGKRMNSRNGLNGQTPSTRNFDGFLSRRLLKSTKGKGNYAAIVEHESERTFMSMHLSDERQKAWAKVEPLLEGSPTPSFYEVMITSGKKRK